MKKKANILAYMASPLMGSLVLVLASLFFIFVLKDSSIIPFFVILLVIDVLCKTLFAVLPNKFKEAARHVSLFIVGSFIMVLAGLLGQQNLNIDGLFFFILSGVFGGTVVHFLNAKIVGPFLSGRSWCGWGCWNAMIFDLLPYKKGKSKRAAGKMGYFRYVFFAVLLLVTGLLVYGFKYHIHNPAPTPEYQGSLRAFYWFAVGTFLYYLTGIVLAIVLKDNRAFCKYVCPASLLLKASSSFSILKIKGDKKSCTNCGICSAQCKMNIKIEEYVQAGTRVTSNECVMCLNCIAACPEAALKASAGFDVCTKNRLNK